MNKEFLSEEEQILDYLKRNPEPVFNDDVVDGYGDEDDFFDFETEEDIARELHNER